MTGKAPIFSCFRLIISLMFKIINIRLKTCLDFSLNMLSFSSSISHQTLNVDITSPTFTDMNIRFAARRDGISGSVSTPNNGFLGLQLNGRVPSQMNARFYGRYPVSIINIAFFEKLNIFLIYLK